MTASPGASRDSWDERLGCRIRPAAPRRRPWSPGRGYPRRVSNLELRPPERVCAAGDATSAAVEVVEAREVPLGGPRAMSVRRTLPHKGRSLVGAWCFLDHYGPDDVSASAGMQVPPHPHTGLQTVSWLFAGEVVHHDSVGSAVTVRPGELNLMTAGRGIAHSEQSPAVRPPLLHGVQLWVALPEGARLRAPDFEHHADLPVADVDGARIRVFLGSLLGVRSPATAYTPIVGAQVDVDAGATVTLPVDPTFEHAVLVDAGDVTLEGTPVPETALGYVAPGRDALTLTAGAGGPARLVLVGGQPFGEQIVMWWNFVGRTHEEVVAARADWQASIGLGATPGAALAEPDAVHVARERFAPVHGFDGPPLPAPELPNLRLLPRT